jgi:UDP-glucose 4-epimerase
MQADVTDQNYNVGTGRRTSLKELAELLLEISGCDKPINYASRSAATLVKNRIGDPEKASKEIGFTASIALRDGLQRLIEWRANHKAEVIRRRRDVGLGE